MAWIGAIIGAGAALFGDEESKSGQEATNAQSTANMIQQEGWQEQMSDTAMQRRVADLKAAGLNPAMAIGGNGAQVSSVGQPSLQNPDAAFGNLGSQVSSAVSTGLQAQATQASVDLQKSQANLNSAQAVKVNAETQTQLPATVAKLQADTNLAANQASQVMANLKLIDAQTQETSVRAQSEFSDIPLKAAQTTNVTNQAQLSQIDQALKGQSLEVLQATKSALISSANSDAQAKSYGLPGLANKAEINKSWVGQILQLLNQNMAAATGRMQ